MDAQASAAGRAGRCHPFFLKPGVDADGLHPFQVPDEACVVSILILTIDGFEIIAREFAALVAKLVDAFFQVWTVPPDERAIFISHPAPFAALLQAHLSLKILPAVAAIHAAGSRERILHGKIVKLFLWHQPTTNFTLYLITYNADVARCVTGSR
jgi:hypothetical protein